MLNLWLVERLFVRVVAAIILSHVCWHVFSPGAEINQNSVMVTLVQEAETRSPLNYSGETLICTWITLRCRTLLLVSI